MDHAEKARALFLEGYNCAQAVVCAFDDLTGLDRETSARLASSFGGGMGRMREVCGTVSGALLVLGQLCGYSDPKDPQAKIDHYHLVQEFARRFRERPLPPGTGIRPAIPGDQRNDHLPGASERRKDEAWKRAGGEDAGVLCRKTMPEACGRSGTDRR